MYDHLKSVLGKLLDERPENAVDNFEDLSKQLKPQSATTEPEDAALIQVQRLSTANVFMKQAAVPCPCIASVWCGLV